jgi:hypothetical protein
MEKMEVALEVMNEILGYLGTRPYQEVFKIIEKLQEEAKVHGMKVQAEQNAAMSDVPKIDAEPV